MQRSADPPARRKNRDDARWRPARKGAGYVEFSYDRNGYLTLRGVVKRRGRRHYADGVPVGYDPTDARIARARREAGARLAVLVARLDRHERPDRKREERTLGRQLRLWLGQVEGRMRRERNYRDYERQVEERLLAYPIAHVAMADLQPEDVDAWLADLRRAGATSYQLRAAYDRLLECLRSFVGDGGAFDGVEAIIGSTRRRRPRHTAARAAPLDDAQIEAFLRHLRSGGAEEPYASFFGVSLCAGLRWGEAAGLGWGDCHGLEPYAAWRRGDRAGEPPAVTVDWRVSRSSWRRTTTELKSERSARSIPLHRFGCEWLADHLERERVRGRGCRPDELVFVMHGRPQKGPWRNAAAAPLAYAYTRRKLVALTEDAGLPATGKTHLMRVTFGTVAGDESVPAHVLQDLLGHADPRTSLIYTRRRSATVRRATEAVGRALGGAKAAEKAADDGGVAG